MPLQTPQARDEMYGVLKTAIAAATSPIDYSAIIVAWDDTNKPTNPSTVTAWLEPRIRHATGGKSGLGADGTSRFTYGGIVTTAIHAPVGDGNLTSDALVCIIKQAYENGTTPNGVWFRNVRAVEIGNVGGWAVTNVIAEFAYDTIH